VKGEMYTFGCIFTQGIRRDKGKPLFEWLQLPRTGAIAASIHPVAEQVNSRKPLSKIPNKDALP
jgi:hypothetical protein